MKKFIVTKKQLNEYAKIKKTQKIFFSIIEQLDKNRKFLNENMSLKDANQTVINNFNRKNLITPQIVEMLVKHKITNKNLEVL